MEFKEVASVTMFIPTKEVEARQGTEQVELQGPGWRNTISLVDFSRHIELKDGLDFYFTAKEWEQVKEEWLLDNNWLFLQPNPETSYSEEDILQLEDMLSYLCSAIIKTDNDYIIKVDPQISDMEDDPDLNRLFVDRVNNYQPVDLLIHPEVDMSAWVAESELIGA